MGGDIVDWLVDHVLPWFLIAVIAFVVVGMVLLPIGLYQAAKSPTFSLRKDEWSCTAAHQQTSTHMQWIGKTAIPVTSTSTVCDAYTRR